MGLSVGLVYETFGAYTRRADDPADFEAEYEPEETVTALAAAFEQLGHRVVRLGTPRALLEAVGRGALPELDAALSIAEGYGSRNREGWAPALLELAGVPCLGSDALSLGLALDKRWATRVVAAAAVPTPEQTCLESEAAALHAPLPAGFPLFVKPRWEGTAKGIRHSSRVEDRPALAREVARVVRDYRQPALVERFLSGPEYTVTIVGHDPARALPVLQRALEPTTRIGLHALPDARATEASATGSEGWSLPGELSPALEAELQALALRAFHALECLDFARADFRLDVDGVPRFLELNPLPTFAPDGSFGILAELEGRGHVDLLAQVLGEALARLASEARTGRA